MQLKLALLLGCLLVATHTQLQTTCTCGAGDVYIKKDNKCTTPDSEVKNCQNYATSGVCSVCEEDYYKSADGKTCTKYETEVENCLTYKAADKCAACKKGYWFESETSCKADPTSKDDGQVENCQTYRKGNSKKPVCNSCDEGYYKKSDTECTALPENCKTNDGTEGKCLACKEGYVVNKDGKCEDNPSNVDNCVAYQWKTDKYICLRCDNEHVLKIDGDKRTCEEVKEADQIEDCGYYKMNGDNVVCQYCGNGKLQFIQEKKDNKISKCIECPWQTGFGAVLKFGLALVALVAMLI